MAYSELIKNFNRIRDYMREFYVYGFKSREEYTKKSARSYDNERRRIESWLGDYMKFRQEPDGKRVFLSIDSRLSHHNPLYTAWKAKSFTDGDITLHFILLDILHSPEITLPLAEITALVDDYLQGFRQPKLFDTSTVRKKLKEYVAAGVIVAQKQGKTMYYRRAENGPSCPPDILDFFSEIAPCGVIGSYLLDRENAHKEHFAFKHHYITGAMDSEILYLLLAAISERRQITVESISRRNERAMENDVIPLRLMISVQSGRRYLMAYTPRIQRITSFRIDNILSIQPGEICDNFDELRQKLDGMRTHMWGVSTQSPAGERLERVEFTVRYSDEEPYIHQRLEREKRCGTVEKMDKNTSRFTAEVFDTSEMIPWIRTFLCRITEIHFSNQALETQFHKDLQAMYALYDIKGGENDDF